MALTPGLYSNSTAATFADARRDLEGQYVRDTAGKIRAGVMYNGSELVTARADMRLDIADFRAVMDRGGAIPVANVGTMQSPAFAAAPAANRRIDLLLLVQPVLALGDTATTPFFEIVTGVASPTPTVPATPANRAGALRFASVEIPAGATSLQSAGVVVTPLYLFSAMAGGLVYVRNTVELAAWTPANGSHAQNLADNSEYVRVGAVWTPTLSAGSVGMLAGFTLDSATVVERRGDTVEGHVQFTRESALPSGTAVAIMNGGYRPISTWQGAGALSGGTAGSCMVQVQTSGNVLIWGMTSTNNTKLGFTFAYKAPPR